MTLHLYEFPEAYRALWDRINEETEGGDTPSDELQEEFENLEGGYVAKVENCAKMIRTLTATHDALDTEAKRLKARAASMKRKTDWLKSYVVESMQGLGHTKIEGEILNVTLARNYRVEMDDQVLVPDRFRSRVEEEKVDVAGIRQALKEGEDVPGARLVETHSIRIR